MRTEFADVAEWAQALPRPTVPQARPLLATVYGIGAFWLTSSLVGGAIGFLFLFVERPQLQIDPVVRQDLPVRETVAILAALVGAAVTRASGGWRAVGLLAAAFAATEAGGYALQQWGCTRIGSGFSILDLMNMCPPPVRFVVADVPRVAGGIVGVLIAPLVGARPRPPSPLLIAAAVVPIWSLVIQVGSTPFVPVRADNVGVSVAMTVLHFLMWIAVGAAVRALRGGPRTLAVLGSTAVFPAAFGLRLVVVMPAPTDMLFWQLLGPALNVASIAALIAGWAAAGALGRRRTADAPSTGQTDS